MSGSVLRYAALRLVDSKVSATGVFMGTYEPPAYAGWPSGTSMVVAEVVGMRPG